MTCIPVPRSLGTPPMRQPARPEAIERFHGHMHQAAVPDSPVVLVVDDGNLRARWPFLGERLREGLTRHGCTMKWETLRPGRTIRQLSGTASVKALVVLGAELEEADLAALPELAIVADIDGRSTAIAPALAARGIPLVEGSRGHAHSKAEMAIMLTLAALRRLPTWHTAMAMRYTVAVPVRWQFSDHLLYVGGTLRDKRVVVVGLDPVGTYVAELCNAFGAKVSVVDPDAEHTDYLVCGVDRAEMEQVPAADIVIVAYGSPRLRVPAHVVHDLAPGALVVTLDSTGIDIAALRERVLRDELAWATDVYESDHADPADPILGRDNMIHTPGIAGKTRDANLAVADVLSENIFRVVCGVPPWPWDRVPPARSTTPQQATGHCASDCSTATSAGGGRSLTAGWESGHLRGSADEAIGR